MIDSTLFPDSDPEKMAREELVSSYNRLKVFAECYRRSEEMLRLDEARLEALLRLNDMASASEGGIISYSLEEAIRLTGSKVGWMGALSPDETMLTMHSWSKSAKEECGILDKVHSICIANGGLWVEPITRRMPVIFNDFGSDPKKSVPYGHIPIRRFMGIPVYDGGHIVAVAEVGNKDSDYDLSDLRQLELLMGGVWRIILRKRADEALSESREQAELYVDFMGHDIRNMNQVAMGFLELAIEKAGSPGGLEKDDLALLEKPMETMRNSAKLIDNVKKLQRLRSGMLEQHVFDLGEVLREVAGNMRNGRGREVNIDCKPAAGCLVKADELLRDVFLNILDNSIRHSRPDTQLNITVSVRTSNGRHQVAIEDDGPGIQDARKSEIFDRLTQGKIKALRTGLGLGLVKTLVESYHGRIWVEDRVSGDFRQGCRFVVELPEAC